MVADRLDAFSPSRPDRHSALDSVVVLY